MPNSDREDQAETMATPLQLPALQPFSATCDQTTLGQRWSGRNGSKVWSIFLLGRILPTRSKSGLSGYIWRVLKFKRSSKLSVALERIMIGTGQTKRVFCAEEESSL